MEVDVRIIYCADPIPFHQDEENHSSLSVAACIGANRTSILSELGIGVKIFNSEEKFLFFGGKSYAYSPLHAWRAYLYLIAILTHIRMASLFDPNPKNHLLSTCWHAASHEKTTEYGSATKNLEALLGSKERFDDVCHAVETTYPSSELLDQFIVAFSQERIALDFEEIEEAVASAALTAGPHLASILAARADERKRRFEQDLQNDHRTLPKEQRLGEFFRSIGIREFVTESALCMYGRQDFCIIGPHELDIMTAEDTYRPYRHTKGKREFTLLVFSKTGEQTAVHPTYTTPDDTRYVFKSATYKKRTFWIKAEIVKNNVMCEEYFYTVEEIRAMIGESLKKKPKSILKRIRDFLFHHA